MKQLIVNADDFGLHTEINKGIIKGHREGFITSTSLMCSAPAFAEAVEMAKTCPKLGIGVHLTLVGGVKSLLPQAEVSTLVDAKGCFPDNYVGFAKKFYLGGINMAQMELELRAQIEAALATGLKITHVDSHQHVHILPGVTPTVVKLCKDYGITKIRIPCESCGFTGGFEAGLGRKLGRAGLTYCSYLARKLVQEQGMVCPDAFFGMLAGGNLNKDRVNAILRALPEGVSEIMTHPGLSNVVLSKNFSWQYHWEEELGAYLAKDNLSYLADNNIELINFGDLKNE